jgi:dynactin complex subunit
MYRSIVLKMTKQSKLRREKKIIKKSNKSFLAVNCDVAETAGKRLWFSDADEKIFFKSEKFPSVSKY